MVQRSGRAVETVGMEERVEREVAEEMRGAREGEEVGDVEVGQNMQEEFVGEVGERERRRLPRGHCGRWSGIWI
jgi:hypothetical protein